jgi:lactate dehydrogenase-like 2-hydroxyacid dehydrogenase
MNRPRLQVTRRLPAIVERELAADFDVQLNERDAPMGAEALRDALGSSDAILCTVTDRFDGTVLAAEPLRARILANFGVGHDHIDLPAAAARSVIVTNTPDVLTDATAELTLLLMLMVARRAGEGEREVRGGRWSGWRPTHMIGRPVAGRTLGIVGMGRIGRAVARCAQEGFGMRILYHTRSDVALGGIRAERHASLETMLREADFISLHCPATPETRHLIDATRLGAMRPDAYLINTARGGVVDEAALASALRAGTIAGAALDVYEREPAVTPALLELENVVLLPHLGSATDAARIAMGRRAHANLRAYLAGDPVPDPVTPAVRGTTVRAASSPPRPGADRTPR